MENREKFSSRIGFLLISAGCAIGLGNVWRFPFITGQYGGAAFCIDLSVLPDHSRAADPCYGICSRKSQSEEYCEILSGVRTERNKMASV